MGIKVRLQRGAMSLLIDGHVHIQPEFDLNVFLENAWENFSRHTTTNEESVSADRFVLLLTEANGCDVFSSLVEKIRQGNDWPEGQWSFSATQEDNSLLAVQGNRKLFLIAGSQLVSSERIELISLFVPLQRSNGSLSLEKLAKHIRDKGGLPLIPWGVGKWLGKRSRIIHSFLESPPVSVFLVGDNGNRPKLWPYPRLLKIAEQQGVGSLAGSDPLRISHHVYRPGVRGGVVEGDIRMDFPARDLQDLLESGSRIESFGSCAGLVQFVCDQFRANVKKKH
jgi:hypothetical protein